MEKKNRKQTPFILGGLVGGGLLFFLFILYVLSPSSEKSKRVKGPNTTTPTDTSTDDPFATLLAAKHTSQLKESKLLKDLCRDKRFEELLKKARKPKMIRAACKELLGRSVVKDSSSHPVSRVDEIDPVVDHDHGVHQDAVEDIEEPIRESSQTEIASSHPVQSVPPELESDPSIRETRNPELLSTSSQETAGTEVVNTITGITSNTSPVTTPLGVPRIVENENNPACNNVKVLPVNLEEIFTACRNFESTIRPFPMQNNRLQSIIETSSKPNEMENLIKEHAGLARILISKEVEEALDIFLNHKAVYGSPVEQSLYVNMSCNAFINRLIQKRPLFFDYQSGKALLRNGDEGEMMEAWKKVGTNEEVEPLVLRDYLSFEEMELASFISIASPTFLISSETKMNDEGNEVESTVYTEAIVIDVTGPCFEHPYLMESKYFIHTFDDAEIRELRNSPLVKKLAEKLYGTGEFQTDEAIRTDLAKPQIRNYTKVMVDGLERYIRHNALLRRTESSLFPVFMYANELGIERDKSVVMRIVGDIRGTTLDRAFQDERIVRRLEYIITEACINSVELVQLYNFEAESRYSREQLSNRFPFFLKNAAFEFLDSSPLDPLPPGKEDSILVIINAAQVNSLPGNAFWLGSEHFSQSSNASIACASTIQELHNPLANPYLKAPEFLNVYSKLHARSRPNRNKGPTTKTSTYNQLVTLSNFFNDYVYPFPLQQNRIHAIVKRAPESDRQALKEKIVDHSKGVRVISDIRANRIAEKFLELKSTSAVPEESQLYRGISLKGFIDRLFTKRPISFFSSQDEAGKTILDMAVLRSPEKSAEHLEEAWLNRQPPLSLHGYLTYEEMEIAALFSIATPTLFMNNGAPDNSGECGEEGTFEKEGIFIGIVGARFEAPGRMEHKYMTVSSTSPTSCMLSEWQELYNGGKPFPVLPLEGDTTGFVQISDDLFLNKEAYRTRMELSYSPVILHANDLGITSGKKVLLRLIAAGVDDSWCLDAHAQEEIIIDVVKGVLSRSDMDKIDQIHFLNFSNPGTETLMKDMKEHEIAIQFVNGNPADPMPKGMEEHLLVATYSSNSNSYPGNEYWVNAASTSSHAAAAACSTISELANTRVNVSIEKVSYVFVSVELFETGKLIEESLSKYPTSLSVEQLLKNSAYFQEIFKQYPSITLPNHTIQYIIEENPGNLAKVEEDIAGVRIIIHQDVLALAKEYLTYKQNHGNPIEKKVYEAMDENGFINRLLLKRPLVFYSSIDTTMLRTVHHRKLAEGMAIGMEAWERVGTEGEQYPLVLSEYLSYHEMEIAALINVAVPTFFVNNLNRRNSSEPGEDGTFTPRGILIGAVGARFENRNMESRHMVYSQTPAIADIPYELRKAWSKLYRVSDLMDTLTSVNTNDLVEAVYNVRMELSYLPIIMHAQNQGRPVVLRLIGLGTGTWAFREDSSRLELIIHNIIRDIIETNEVPNIDLIEFLWMAAPPRIQKPPHVFQPHQIAASPDPNKYGITRFKDKSGRLIDVHYHQGNPSDPMPSGKEGHLLVTMYAGDGNAFPGNEYWKGALFVSGNPAAACGSTITELQNPYINIQLRAPERLQLY